jgi:hypothetical protein
VAKLHNRVRRIDGLIQPIAIELKLVDQLLKLRPDRGNDQDLGLLFRGRLQSGQLGDGIADAVRNVGHPLIEGLIIGPRVLPLVVKHRL